ncbi:hypothetical protein ACOSP7_032504 [Xanthoceras sorbifolium]
MFGCSPVCLPGFFPPAGPQVTDSRFCWKAHLSGFKVNVDAAVDVKMRCFNVGVIVRDTAGQPLFAAAKSFDYLFDVEVSEGRAILEGIESVVFLHLSNVIIESDALNLVKLCNGLLCSLAEVDNVVQDVQFLLGLHPSFSVAFVSRVGNNVTHCLAKWAVGNFSSCSWFVSSFPDWLLKLIRVDGCSVSSV